MIISTTDTILGKKIVKMMGVIEARCSAFVFNEAKSAQKNLEKKAEESGANAIIGFKIEKVSGVAHAYGTAVIVEDEKGAVSEVEHGKQAGQVNYCPKCGARLPNDAVYCPECGHKIRS